MQDLKEVLDSVLAEAKFDMGRDELNHAGLSLTYSCNPDETVSADGLRSLAARQSWVDRTATLARRAKVIVLDEAFAPWLSAIRELLGDYINQETGKIGHAFPMESSRDSCEAFSEVGVTSQSQISPVDGFAKTLIRGAAILGTARLVEMLRRWVDEQSVLYRTSAVLNGLYIDDRLAPLPHIRIEPLPRSTDGAFGCLPMPRACSIEDFLGRTLLTIDSIARPAFFRPEEDRNVWPVQAQFASSVGMDTVCQALALEADTDVEMAFQWNDYDEASLYLDPASRSHHSTHRGGLEPRGTGVSLRKDWNSGVTTASIEEQKIRHPSEDKLKSILLAMAGKKETSAGVAISRWCKSKEAFRTLPDRFIDLRVALEALFLRNFDYKNRGEMKFRLALFAAWYIGANFAERKQIRQTLGDSYDVASRAVHGAPLPRDGNNWALLSKSQELCRRGILKFLDEGVCEDWADLVLGAALEKREDRETDRRAT